MRELAIEGIDGSGKTTVIGLLAESLEAKGQRTAVFAPFRMANEMLGHDIYELWFDEESAKTGVRCLRKVIEKCRQQAIEKEADWIIYDRHWMTGICSIVNAPLSYHYWLEHGPPMVDAAYLRTSPEISIQRKAKDGDEDLHEPWMETQALQGDVDCLEAMASGYPEHMLGIYCSDHATPEELAATIEWDMNIRR